MTSRTRLLLLRHAPTEWNEERRLQGRSDPPLSEKGERLCAEGRSALAALGPSVVYSSPLRRARQTAEILVEGLSLGVRVEPGLAELDFGDLEGRSLDPVDPETRDVIRRWRKDPAGLRWPGGESLADVQVRVARAVDGIAAAHEGQTVLLLSHCFAILAEICRVLGLELGAFRRMWNDPLGLSVVERGSAGPDGAPRAHLRSFNQPLVPAAQPRGPEASA